MADGPCELSARVLARRLRRRQLTTVEVLEAHLERIERHNPDISAVVSLDAERARASAEAADAALRRDEIWGPLHGVPMTLKDAHDVAGLRTTVGTDLFDGIAEDDGTAALRRLRRAPSSLGHDERLHPPRHTGAPIDIDGESVSYWENGRLVVLCNLTGHPGLVVPAGLDDGGLPIGIQIIGPRWSDMRLLEIAGALERAGILPGFQAPPATEPRRSSISRAIPRAAGLLALLETDKETA